MSAVGTCNECGGPIPAVVPEGLCRKCLLELGLEEAQRSKSKLQYEGMDVSTLTERPGDRIGRYKLLEKIGEGGFGVVYLADQQEPVKRHVALKIIKLGMDTRQVVARFEAERQTLALMDHPNIARVLDGGATGNGRPYFVMELVKGIPITDYCNQANLSTRERLKLLIEVCNAVQHAHQKGVIHRDLKPGNVLTALHDGRPVPKIIDFGVAKALGQKLTEKTLFTRFEQMIGTPAYMSPEQAALSGLDLDTRSDIYSLGALLYELLTGATPLNARLLRNGTLDEIRRMIRETDPPKPSTRLTDLVAAEVRKSSLESGIGHPKSEMGRASLRRLLQEKKDLICAIQGDLDWITMKALEKDRQRRYQTVNALAQDIEGHLNNEPVMARPPSNLYRFEKWMRRNKLAFSAATAVVTSLAFGLGIATWLFFKERAAHRSEREARVRATIAEKTAQAATATATQRAAEEATQRQRAEASDAQVKAAFAASDFLQAVRLIAGGEPADALAYLQRSVSLDPANQASLTRLMSLLSYRAWMLPDFAVKHNGRITVAHFSPDGTRVVTGSEDGMARVWNAQNGEPITEPMAHDKPVVWVKFAPDGKSLVTMSGGSQSPPIEGIARVWDVPNGHPLTPPTRHTSVVAFPQYGPDGTLRLIASTGNTLRVWYHLQTTQPLTDPIIHISGITSAHFSPDAGQILTLSRKSVQVWDARNGQPVGAAMTHPDSVQSAEFSPDGSRIITASADKSARIWNAQTGELLGQPMKHGDGVTYAQFSPDGNLVVTASKDNTARVWNARTGQPVTEPLKHKAWVWSAQFSPDSKRIVTACFDMAARLWDANTGRLLTEPMKHSGEVMAAEFSPDGKRILTVSWDGAARVWSLLSSPILAEPFRHRAGVLSPDHKRIVALSADQTQVWDMRTDQPLSMPMRHIAPVSSAQFSADGSQIVTVSTNEARIWDAQSGQPFSRPMKHNEPLSWAEFSPDAKRIVTVSSQQAWIWDAQTGQLLGQPLQHPTMFFAQFSADGTRVMTAGHDSIVRVWDVQSGRQLGQPMKHDWVLHLASLSPDGRRIVTASADETARLWDAETGQLLFEPIKHSGIVDAAEFSPDGQRVVTAAGNVALLWDSLSGEPMTEPMKHHRPVWSAKFSSDGNRIVTVSENGTAQYLPNRTRVVKASIGSAQVWDAQRGQPLTEPIENAGGVDDAVFSADGKRIMTTSGQTTREWEIAPPEGAIPHWLPRLVEAVAGQALNKNGVLQRTRSSPAEAIAEIRKELAVESGQNAWSRWARWFLDNPESRPISPSSNITVPQYHIKYTNEPSSGLRPK